jgi:hypothetical protein
MGKVEDLLEPFLAGAKTLSGEQRMRCPLPEHDDNEASASVNWVKRVWHCMGCGEGGSLGKLLPRIKKSSTNGHGPDADEADVVDLKQYRTSKRQDPVGQAEALTEAKVKRYMAYLRSKPTLLSYLTDMRGFTVDTLDKFEIGFDENRGRYVIPVRDEHGSLVNFRRYKRDGKPKFTNAFGHGTPPRLYPDSSLESDSLVLAEGEWDALLTIQHGWPAVTGTHGSTTWDTEWSKQLKDKKIYVCYDNDKVGRLGAKRAARSLAFHAEEVHVIILPVEEEKQDLTDWWVDYEGRGGRAFAELLASSTAQPRRASTDVTGTPQPANVSVIGSMDSSTNGRPLSMRVTVVGRKDPTYSVPHKVHLECTMDAGPKCKLCPMNADHEGDVEITINPNDVSTVSRFIDANAQQTQDLLRKYVGAAKCTRLKFHELTNHSVEELFVTGSVEARTSDEGADYTQRRLYNVGAHSTPTNMPAAVVGTTHPNPKDRHNEFLAWQLEQSQTSIDQFVVSPEVVDRLRIFRPSRGQSPIAKCWEIAEDLATNVTTITGRERLHIALDLVWHSVLHFPLDGKTITKGWLEFLVVGDTRTGKSETAQRLSEHYGLGHVVGCEGATFAGLVGGAKQVGNQWILRWGEITVNDRRLVVLDEASGLSQEIISQLSDIRSRGVAQVTKIETQQTNARCRLVWISNARKDRFLNEQKYDGIDIIEDLIGNPEDIARFDFAMSVSMKDVPIERIHKQRERTQPKYTSELCQELILWAWSRKAEDVEWETRAYEAIYTAAEWLGKRYHDHPPLIQSTNVREKVARLAVAMAARTFSSDRTGRKLIVKYTHVRDATRFLDRLYSYDNFGYLRLSQRIQNNRQIARNSRRKVRAFLGEHHRLLEFLLDRRSSFRAPDLEEMAQMTRDEASFCLSTLSDAKMVRKEKAQIVIEPELNELLRQLEKERSNGQRRRK